MKHVHDLAQAILALPANELRHLVELIVDEREAEIERSKDAAYAQLTEANCSHQFAKRSAESAFHDTRLDAIADTLLGYLEAHA